MENWIYEGKSVNSINDLPKDTFGFVYRITHKESGKFYIGKKQLISVNNKPLTKKEIAEWDRPGRVPKKKKVTSESNWMSYWGSSKTLQSDIKQFGYDAFTREIIKPCFHKKQLTYWEIFYQFRYEVLHIDSYNDNIISRIFRKDI